MNKYSVFDTQNKDELNAMIREVGAEKRICKKNDVLMKASENQQEIGILKSGIALLVSINAAGEKNILQYYEPGNIFGSVFFPHTNVNLYYISAKTNCTFQQLTLEHLQECCKRNLQYSLLINNIIMNVTQRELIHSDILSQRTIRNKLMTYFRYIAERTDNNIFTLPLPLSDIADYICADRSAMMREIKKMNEDGIIESKGNQILSLHLDMYV